MKIKNKQGLHDVVVQVSNWEEQQKINKYYKKMGWDYYDEDIHRRHYNMKKGVAFHKSKHWSQINFYKTNFKIITPDEAVNLIKEYLSNNKPKKTMNKLKEVYAGIGFADNEYKLIFVVDSLEKAKDYIKQDEIKIFSLNEENGYGRLNIDLPETVQNNTTPEIALKSGMLAGILADGDRTATEKIKDLKDVVTDIVNLCMN